MGKSKYQLVLSLSSYLAGNLSSGIFTFVLSLHIFHITSSSFAFAMILLLEPVALLLSSPFVGAIVDRNKRKSVVLLAQSTSVGVVLLAIVLFELVKATLGQVFMASALVFFLTVCDNFQKVAYRSATVNLVDREDHERLIVGEQLVSALMMLATPILGGMLYPILSLTQAMLVEMLGEVLVIVLLAKLSFTAFGKEFIPDVEAKNWHSFSKGLKYISQDQTLMALLFFGVLANLVLAAVIIGEPVVLLQQRHISTQVYGWIEACLAIGMIVGSVLVGVFRIKGDKRSYTAKVGMLITGIFLFLAMGSFVQQKLWIGIVFALSLCFLGCAICLANIPYTLHMRTKIDVQKQGRINATAGALISLASPIGLAVFGILFNFLSAETIFFCAGIVMLIVSLKLFRESKN